MASGGGGGEGQEISEYVNTFMHFFLLPNVTARGDVKNIGQYQPILIKLPH